jgi:hypothetical protein
VTHLQQLCIVCLERELWSTSMVCGGCFARMRSDLAWLEWAYFWLEEAMTELAPSWRSGSIHAHQSEAPAPFPLQMLDARDQILGILRSWARLIGEEYQPAGPGPDGADVQTVTAWILAKLGWCSDQPWCDQFAEELADTRKLAYGLAPWEAHRRSLPAPCRGCGNLTLAQYGTDESAICRNRECGRIFTWGEYEVLVKQWAQLVTICESAAAESRITIRDAPGLVDPDDPAQKLLTTSQAAAAAHVSESTIRTWADRGKLTPVPISGPSPHYWEIDVLAVEASTRRRRRRHAIGPEVQLPA